MARVIALLLLFLHLTNAALLPAPQKRQETTTSPPKPLPSASDPLECFQVAQPVLGPRGPVRADTVFQDLSEVKEEDEEEEDPNCSVQLMDHTFGWSYDLPFIGTYTPPAPSSCQFDRVILNLTVLSAGHQFDRLAVMYLGDTEVWRTSTAEPREKGIVWTYWKDMTQYLSLWREPQKIIFDLGNLIDDTYTGPFNTTLTATFFKARGSRHKPKKGPDSESEGSHGEIITDPETVAEEDARDGPADVIIPISARQGSLDDKISAWNVPDSDAVTTVSQFPRNARRAVLSVSANGQQAEEFWWSNLPESDTGTFNRTAGMYYGLSPWREVQVLIDGKLAGVQWPFPVLFTGGVNPAFHRPIVGLDAFDLREHEIDVTPWLPLLCDGGEHSVRIQIAGIDNTVPGMTVTDRVASYWVVTGKIFVWLDEDEGSVTTGDVPYASGGTQNVQVQYRKKLDQDTAGYNETLAFEMQAERDFSVRNRIVTSAGEREVRWSQSLRYVNRGTVGGYGFDQVNDMTISGVDTSYGPNPYRSEYSYPLHVSSEYRVDQRTGDFSINATLRQGLDLAVSGASVFPTGLEPYHGGYDGSQLSTFRDGAAYLYRSGDRRSGYGYGNMDQEFSFSGTKKDDHAGSDLLYGRKVSAVNDTVVFDDVTMAGGRKAGRTFVAPAGVVEGLGTSGSVDDYAVDPALVKPLAWRGTELVAAEAGGSASSKVSGGSDVVQQWWLSWFRS